MPQNRVLFMSITTPPVDSQGGKGTWVSWSPQFASYQLMEQILNKYID